MKKCLLFLPVLICLAGCDSTNRIVVGVNQKVADVTAPDPLSVSELVKTHPRLQNICDLAGGCDKVEIECTKYDNTGNSQLRGEIVWRIDADIPNIGHVFGISFKKTLLEGAIKDWFRTYEMKKEEASRNHGEKIYPNTLKCDKDCIK